MKDTFRKHLLKNIDADDADDDIIGWDPAFFEFIDRLKERKIVKGYADGSFGPGNKITKFSKAEP